MFLFKKEPPKPNYGKIFGIIFAAVIAAAAAAFILYKIFGKRCCYLDECECCDDVLDDDDCDCAEEEIETEAAPETPAE